MNARRWVPMTVAAAAVALFSYGAWAFVQGLNERPSEPPSRAPEGPISISGKKRPSELMLPEYPTAFDFRSQDAGFDRGFSAFSVRKGTSKEIAAFYRKHLPEVGWEFERSEVAKQRFGEEKDPKSVLLTGVRQYWREQGGPRNLVFLAMDLVNDRSTAQVALNWSTPPPAPAPADKAAAPQPQSPLSSQERGRG